MRAPVVGVVVLLLVALGGASTAGADGGKVTAAAFAFRVRASNGYGIVVFAASRRPDGGGIAVISVTKSRSKHSPRTGVFSEVRFTRLPRP